MPSDSSSEQPSIYPSSLSQDPSGQPFDEPSGIPSKSSSPTVSDPPTMNPSTMPTKIEGIGVDITIIGCVAAAAAVSSAASSVASLNATDSSISYFNPEETRSVHWQDDHMFEIKYYYKGSDHYRVFDVIEIEEESKSIKLKQQEKQRRLEQIKQRIKKLATEEGKYAKEHLRHDNEDEDNNEDEDSNNSYTVVG